MRMILHITNFNQKCQEVLCTVQHPFSFCTTRSLYFRYVLIWTLNSEKVKSLVTELQNEEENQSSL